MIYVDDMRAPFRGMLMCHMVADTATELHAMADWIGIARKWYQGDHYDISISKRAKAVAAGAREVERKVLAIMVGNRRRGLPLGTPETCMAIAAQRKNIGIAA